MFREVCYANTSARFFLKKYYLNENCTSEAILSFAKKKKMLRKAKKQQKKCRLVYCIFC